MKRLSVLIFAFVLLAAPAACEEASRNTPTEAFFKGNVYYEARDYAKAVESYASALNAGAESGNLYYNMGNAFFKLGKVGRAILCYRKARRLIPHDSDLKSNLEYARSFVDEAAEDVRGHRRFIFSIIAKPFRELNLNAIAISATAFYLITMALLAAALLNPIYWKRLWPAISIFAFIMALNLAGFGIRYYVEYVLRHAVIVEKAVEAKYEPIDSSVTYYTIREGSSVLLLKTRNGWSQVKRSDGKIGWVKKETVAEV